MEVFHELDASMIWLIDYVDSRLEDSNSTELVQEGVAAIAREELAVEHLREAIDARKKKLLEEDQRSFFRKIFPWKISITRV